MFFDRSYKYWMQRIPEIEAFEGVTARRKAVGEAARRAHAIAWLVACCAFAMVAVIVVKEFFWGALSSFSPVSDMLLSILTGLGMVYGHTLIVRRRMQQSVREQLNAAGRPTCMGCGYDLRGQGAPRCPECGREFELPLEGDAVG